MKHLLILSLLFISFSIFGWNWTPEDVDNNGIINVSDIMKIKNKWGSIPNGFTPEDVNGDGKITIYDIMSTVKKWGKIFTFPYFGNLYPNGGETITDTIQNITWNIQSPKNTDVYIDIYYSLNSGITWLPIVLNIPNTGIYPFDFNRLRAGNNYRIKISAHCQYGRQDIISQSDFTILNEEDENFNFSTRLNKSILILAGYYKNDIFYPYPNIRFDLYIENPDIAEKSSFSGVTDSNGYLICSYQPGSYVKTLYAKTNYPGLPSVLSLNTNPDTILFNFVRGKTESPKTSSKVFTQAEVSGTDFSLTKGTWESTTGLPSYLFDVKTPDSYWWNLWNRVKSSLPELTTIDFSDGAYGDITNRAYLEMQEAFPVFATFLYEDTANMNSFGYYTYNTGSIPSQYTDISATTTVIFPNMSYPGYGGNLKPGSRVYIGTFFKGKTLGFFRSTGGFNNSTGFVSKTANTKFSNTTLNTSDPSDKRLYFVALYDPGTNTISLGTEDTDRSDPSCDNDFNDNVIILSTVEGFNISGFISYYRFEEDSYPGGSNDVFDETGSYPARSYNTPNKVDIGKSDRAIYINSAQSECLDTGITPTSIIKTLNFWYRPYSTTGYRVSGVLNGNNGFYLGANGTSLVAMYGTGSATVNNVFTKNPQDWYMLSMVNRNGTVSLYVDGVERTTFSGVWGTESLSSFLIGAQKYWAKAGNTGIWTNQYYCLAYFDEFVFDSRAWSEDEINEAYLFGDGRALREFHEFPVLDYSNKVDYTFTNSTNYTALDSTKIEYTTGLKLKAALNPPAWTDLLAYYKFEEASYNGTANEVENKIGTPHGTAIGNANTSTGGILNRCATSDGLGDYITTGITPSNTIKTMNFWFKSPNIDTYIAPDTTRKIYIGIEQTNSNFYIGLQSRFNNGHNGWLGTDLVFGYGDRISTLQNVSISNDTWMMLTLTFDGTNAYAHLNGGSVNGGYTIGPLGATFGTSSTNPLALMAYHNGASYVSINCKIDEFVLDKNYWTNEYLTYMYNNGAGRNLVGYPLSSTYVTTNSSGQLNKNRFSSIMVTQSLENTTDIRYLFSTDNKSTWYYWDSPTHTWKTTTLTTNNLMGKGMTKTLLQSLVATDLDALPVGTNTFDLAIGMSTTDGLYTPWIYKLEFFESSLFSNLQNFPPLGDPYFEGPPYFWDKQGKPFNLSTPVAIDATFTDDLNQTVTQNQVIVNYQLGKKVDLDIKTDNTMIYFTFASESNANLNSWGYYSYQTGSPPASFADLRTKLICLWPNSNLTSSGGLLTAGDTVAIGPFNSGTSIGFAYSRNGWDSDLWFPGNSDFWVSQEYLNTTETISRQHFVTFHYPTRNGFVICTEDSPRGDGTTPSANDFTDVTILLTFNQTYTDVITDNTNYPIMPKDPTPVDTDGDGIPDTSDDFPLDPLRAFIVYGPSYNMYGSLGFEDLWPFKGDYDFNDVIIDYYYREIANATNDIVEIEAKYRIKAVSSGIWNQHGFGIQFDNLLPTDIASVTTDHIIPQEISTLNPNGTETDQSKAVIIVFESHRDAGLYPQENRRFNASDVTTYDQPPVISMKIVFTTPVTRANLGFCPYNPFLIKQSKSTNRFYRKGRGHEIHLKDKVPTDKAITSYWGGGTDDDQGDGITTYYRDSTGRPFAIDTPVTFSYPNEIKGIEETYFYFPDWAQSEGENYQDWYLPVDPSYRDETKIYTHPDLDTTLPEE